MGVASTEVSWDGAGPWLDHDELASHTIPPGLARFLTARGSLTGLMRNYCGTGFSLTVLAEHPARGDGSLSREVVMRCDDFAVVFARTEIGAAALRMNPWLRHIGERPLGEALSEHGEVTRGAFQYCALASGMPLHEAAAQHLPNQRLAYRPLWARRSLLHAAGSALEVREVFLPSILRLCES